MTGRGASSIPRTSPPRRKPRLTGAPDKALFDQSGFRPHKHWVNPIEDRGSQITPVGPGAGRPSLDEKKTWDPDFAKRQKIKALLEPSIPEFSVGLGGTTSIDVTRRGVDKAYGLRKLEQVLGVSTKEMIFVGDALFPGGNDYPARSTDAICIAVRDPEDTKKVVEVVIACVEP